MCFITVLSSAALLPVDLSMFLIGQNWLELFVRLLKSRLIHRVGNIFSLIADLRLVHSAGIRLVSYYLNSWLVGGLADRELLSSLPSHFRLIISVSPWFIYLICKLRGLLSVNFRLSTWRCRLPLTALHSLLGCSQFICRSCMNVTWAPTILCCGVWTEDALWPLCQRSRESQLTSEHVWV